VTVILTDNPIRDASADEFGFRAHAEVLCAAVAEVHDLPLTLAVLGSWGSGKTSFLNICRSLLQERGMITVGFGPWKYDQRDEVWHALLQTLLDELARQAANSQEPSVKQRLGAVLARLRRLSVAAAWLLSRQAVNTFTPMSLDESDLDELRTAASHGEAPGLAADYHAVNQFERDFAEVVRELTGGAPLAIFIDDLDRCRPETALSVLEALRIFTGDAPCLFVIAIDHDALIDAAARYYDGDRQRGRRYLEKLVHFSYHLPGIRWESLGNALRSRLDFLPEDPVVWEVDPDRVPEQPTPGPPVRRRLQPDPRHAVGGGAAVAGTGTAGGHPAHAAAGAPGVLRPSARRPRRVATHHRRRPS
jgi:hypothetical protein